MIARLRLNHNALKETCITLRREKDEMKNQLVRDIQKNIESVEAFLNEELSKFDKNERSKQHNELEEKNQQLRKLQSQVLEATENEHRLKETIEKLLHEQSINKDVASRLLIEKEEQFKKTINGLVENHAVQIAEITENWEHEKRMRIDLERSHHAEIHKIKQEYSEKLEHLNIQLKEKQELLDHAVIRANNMEKEMNNMKTKLMSDQSEKKTTSDRTDLLAQQVTILEQALLESKEKEDKLVANIKDEREKHKREIEELQTSHNNELKHYTELQQEKIQLEQSLVEMEERIKNTTSASNDNARKHEQEMQDLKAKIVGLEKALELRNVENEMSMLRQIEQKDQELKSMKMQCIELNNVISSLNIKIRELESCRDMDRKTWIESESSLKENLSEVFSQLNRSKEKIILLEDDIALKDSTIKELENKGSESLQQLLKLQSTLTERGNVILNMDREMKSLKEENTALKTEIENKLREVQDMDQNLREGSSKISTYEVEIQSLRELINTNKEIITKLTSEKSMMEKQISTLLHDASSSTDQLSIEKNNLELEKSKLEVAYQHAVESSKKQKEKLQTLSNKVLELERLLVEKNNELKNLQTACHATDQKFNELLSELNKTKEEHSIQLVEKDRMISSLVQKSTELTKKLAEHSSNDQIKKDLEKENSVLKEEILSLSKEKDVIVVEQEKLSKLVHSLNKSIDDLKKEKNELQRQIISSNNGDNTSTDEKCKIYESQVQTLSSKNKDLLEMLEKHKSELITQQNFTAEIERKLKQSEAVTENIRKELQEKQSLISVIKAELSNKDAELKNSKTLCSDSINAIKKLELSVQDRDREIIRLKKELEKNIILLEKGKTEITHHATEKLSSDAKSSALPTTSSEVTQLRNELAQTKLELENVKDKLQSLSSEQKKNQILIDISTKPTSKEKILSHIQTLIIAVEKAKQEKYHYKKICKQLEEELEKCKKLALNSPRQQQNIEKLMKCENIIKEARANLKRLGSLND